jgi:hypothetical protein
MVKCFLKGTTTLLFVTGLKLCQASKHSTLQQQTTPTRALGSIRRKSPLNERDLQNSGFNYHANYTAQFQYLLDVDCFGPAPVIHVSCLGPNIQLIGVSDPSIVCSKAFVDGDEWTTIECNNTCASELACQDVYLNLGGLEVVDGPLGEIRFLCQGDSLDSIYAAVSFVDSGNGTCASSSSPWDTGNLHVARMGVSCPTASGAREYVFDDFYFECSGGLAFPGDGYPGDVYTCFDGQNCDGIACVVDFTDMYINADVPKFQDKCVEPAVPLIPTPALVLNPTGFTYSARFEAAWGLLFDPLYGSACSSDIPTVRITCRNGDIKFVNSTYGTVKCTTMSPGVMECTDNSTNFVDQFTGVVYVSGVIGLSCDHR